MAKYGISKKIKIFVGIILVISIFFTIINVVPPKKVVEENLFIIEEGSRPLIAAHRGGKNLNPENTFKAFDYSIANYDIDIIELDLCLTKDQHLVLNHNMTINDCTDVSLITSANYYVNDHTLEELQKFNFGYNFKDSNGKYLYRNLLDEVNDEDKSQVLLDNKLRVVTVEELFAAYKDTDLMYIMEIKDDGNDGKAAADILVNLIYENKLEKKVAIGTFHDTVEEYLETEYPEIIRGGSVGAVTGFVITQMLGVNIFDNSTFACLQIPVSREAMGVTITLDKRTYINRCHRRNISVQFWTINEKEEMRELIEKGADVIMTDNPDVLYELLEEMGF